MTVDLTTTYMGISLAHPLVPSASPLSGNPDALHRLVEAGAAAIVLPSLFEEQVEHEAMAIHEALEFGAANSPEATEGYFPEMDRYNTGPGRYLDLVRTARAELDVPIIASVNGSTPGGWTLYAKILADEGDRCTRAQRVPGGGRHRSPRVPGRGRVPPAGRAGAAGGPGAARGQDRARSSPRWRTWRCRLSDAGADGLVIFNRFYQPDIDLDRLEVRPNLVLSSSAELRLVLRWIAILHGRVDVSLAATTGIHDADDVVKVILAGADVTMMASALLRHGPSHLTAVLQTGP